MKKQLSIETIQRGLADSDSKDIIGDFCGEKVGISSYDYKTMYWVGDEIEIKDFNYSDAECFTGFHFFCSLEEARHYN